MTTYVELRLVSGTVVDDPNQRSGCVGEIRAICDLMILRIFLKSGTVTKFILARC
jgi:hypothetical protein